MTKRPNMYADDIVASAAAALAPDVAKWLEEDVDDSMIGDLAKAMAWDTDGYALAKRLERCWSIDPDSELVETLDHASGYLIDAHRAAVAAWVTDCSITPTYAVGDTVVVKHHRDTHTGTIVRIDAATAYYLVNIPALGHVGGNAHGTHGLYIPYENVMPADGGN